MNPIFLSLLDPLRIEKEGSPIRLWKHEFDNFRCLPDADRVDIGLLVDRGTHPFRDYRVSAPRASFDDPNEAELVMRYVAAFLHNRLVTEGGRSVVIQVSVPHLEERVSAMLRKELIQTYHRLNFYGNFGEPIEIFSSREYCLRLERTVSEPRTAFNPATGCTVGVDVGGTNIKTVVMQNGVRIFEQSEPVDRGAGAKAIVDQVERLVSTAIASIRGHAPAHVDGIGVALAAVLKEHPFESPQIIRMTNFERHWAGRFPTPTEDKDLGPHLFMADYEALNTLPQRLRDTFGTEIVGLINDANAFGFQEVVCRGIDQSGSIVVLPLGTGTGYVKVASGLIEDLPHQGGHMIVDLSGQNRARQDKGCGHFGCFAAYSSATALENRLAEVIAGQGTPANLKADVVGKVLGIAQDIGRWIATAIEELSDIIPDLGEVLLAAGVVQGLTGELIAGMTSASLSDGRAKSVRVALSTTDVNWGGAMGAAQYANWLSQRRGGLERRCRDHGLPKIRIGKNIIDGAIRELESEKVAVVIRPKLRALLEARKDRCPWVEQLFRHPELHVTECTQEALDRHADGLRRHKFTKLVAVGSGTITDIAKYLGSTAGNRERIGVVVIPTAISTNSAFAEKAIIYTPMPYPGRRRAQSVAADPPEAVYFDLEFIRLLMDYVGGNAISAARANRAGAGDILSIATALHDWKSASTMELAVYWDSGIAKQMRSLFLGLDRYAKDIYDNSDLGWLYLVYALAEASLVNMCFGSSRPKDGSEHILAQMLEEGMENRPHLHGELVALAVPIMAELQQQDPSHLRNLAERLGLPIMPERAEVSKEELVAAVQSLTPRRDKFTAVDFWAAGRPARSDAETLVDRVLGTVPQPTGTIPPETDLVEDTIRAVRRHISEEVIERLDPEATASFVERLRGVSSAGGRVFLNAAGRSGEIGMYFLTCLAPLRKVEFYRVHEQTNLDLLRSSDLVLCISASGQTSSVAERAWYLSNLDDGPQIVNLTATSEVPSWHQGKQISIRIAGKSKLLPKLESADFLPLGSTFEYSVLLYLEGILRALAPEHDSSLPNELSSVVRLDMHATLVNVVSRVLPGLRHQRDNTGELIRQLASVEPTTMAQRGGAGRIMRMCAEWVDRGRPPFIFFLGVGRNNHIVRLLAGRMRNIGFNVAVPGPDQISPPMKQGDVAFAITMEGNEPRLLAMLEQARGLNNPCLVITARQHSPGTQLATLMIFPVDEQRLVSLSYAEVQRTFELGSLLYLEGLAVSLMRTLDRTEMEYTPPEFE